MKVFSVFLLVFLTACQEDKAVLLTDIQVDRASLNMTVGDRVQIRATPVPEGAGADFVWMSDDETVATTTGNGLVSAVAEGTTGVYVGNSDGSVKVKISVTVGKKSVPVAGISVSVNEVSLSAGGTAAVTALPVPPNADATFVWSSENELIASVNAEGLISGHDAGVSHIVVATPSGDIKKRIKVTVSGSGPVPPTTVLYHKTLTDMAPYPELSVGGAGQYVAQGLNITANGSLVRLDKFYALGQRLVRYRVRFSADAKAVFRTNNDGDFKAYVDMPGKQISVATRPATPAKTVDFLTPEHEYAVEIYRSYQQHKIRITDLTTGQSDELSAIHDGTGGVGQGAVQPGFYVGGQHDYYCFGMENGAYMLVRQISVLAQESDFWLMIYGDSISEPEGYFPTANYPQSWTQRIMNHVNRRAVSSGRGGGNIDDLTDRIKNELPFVKAEYVMVTIGTNGGNTETKLSALVEYIQSQGAIPILNNIPCNESGTQIAVNQVIHQVRQKYDIKGCRFDFATSLNGDGQQVDQSTMYWENYTNGWGEIYHHPNEKGGQQMFDRTLIDLPEIYE
ncbi:MAG: Ig-like domain-containing protein [Bacteroidales bacterium]|jgi:hypothetical protein|nr:Ig-like domain-containing protein [Bacteroidales bacterium]